VQKGRGTNGDFQDQKDKEYDETRYFFNLQTLQRQEERRDANGDGALGKHLILLEGSSGTLLGEALVADELGADSLERRVTLGLDLLDTVTVGLLVLVVVGVVLGLGHFTLSSKEKSPEPARLDHPLIGNVRLKAVCATTYVIKAKSKTNNRAQA